MSLHLTFIIIYALALIVLSQRFYRKQPAAEDFQIGSRSFGINGVFASTVTIIGGGELLTVAALAFANDGAAITLLSGYGIGLIALGALAARLRTRAGVNLYNTLPDYFYGEYGKLAGGLATVFTALAVFALLILQFSAGAVVLNSLAPNVSILWSTMLPALVVALYLCLAGFRGVVLTDKIQFFTLLVGLPLLAFLTAPSVSEAVTSLATLDFTPLGTILTLLTGVFVILGSGDIWQRMYAAESNDAAKRGLCMAGAGFAVFGALLAIVGVAAKLQGLTDDPNAAFVAASLAIQNPLLSAIVLLTVFSAILSTADTETFMLAGMIVRERVRWSGGYKDNRLASEGTNVRAVRWLIIVVALVGALVSLRADSLVDIYTLLLQLLLVLAPAVVIGAFLPVRTWAVASAIVVGAVLLVSLFLLGAFSLEYAVALVVPGFLICLTGAFMKRSARND